VLERLARDKHPSLLGPVIVAAKNAHDILTVVIISKSDHGPTV
jgi:hypothetical protein